jgi:hypothetical protein
VRKIYVLVEGQTEEIIVRDFLQPGFGNDVWLTPVILKTRRAAGGPPGRGGVSTWKKIEQDLRLLLRDPSFHCVTTLIDYYGLPNDSPGMSDRPHSSPHDRVTHVERAISTAMGNDPRLIPNLVLHETEAWVLAAAEELANLLGKPMIAKKLKAHVDRAGGPELVNEKPSTAPSKRILAAYPGYRKTHDGPNAVVAHGLDALRRTCPHLDLWVKRILQEGG